MQIELRKVMSRADLEAAKSIRFKVFVNEQNVPLEIEMDDYDAEAIHVICLLEGIVVGTGRLVKMPDGMKLGRVAVLVEHRKKGLGAGIVKWLLEQAKQIDTKVVYANVQINAKSFYEKLGFKAEGPLFLEAGIQHVKMLRPNL